MLTKYCNCGKLSYKPSSIVILSLADLKHHSKRDRKAVLPVANVLATHAIN